MNKKIMLPLSHALITIIDNRGKSVPTTKKGFPLIATNCIKESSIYPTFENIRYVDGRTLNSWFRAHLAPNDILFVNKGTPGRVCLVPDPVTFCAAQDMIGLRVDNTKINYKYLFAHLRSNWVKKKIENFHVGLVIPHFKKQDLDNILIPQKSKEEQEFIGNLYISLSKKIELNNRINAELEAMAKTLYDYWFVQFDFPYADGRPYKSSGGKMVYNKDLKREIPEGWDVNIIKNLLRTELGGTPSTADTSYWKGDISWLNSGEIANFPVIESEAYITQKAIDSSATTLMPAGTCVISITRHLRPSILAINACANQSVVGILESKNIKSSFIYPYLKNEIPRYMSLRTGAQQPHINKGTIDNSFMIIPPDKVLQYYYSKANNWYNLIIKKSLETKQLTSLRDWLLPMLMNGQVTVGGKGKNVYMPQEEKINMAAEPE